MKLTQRSMLEVISSAHDGITFSDLTQHFGDAAKGELAIFHYPRHRGINVRYLLWGNVSKKFVTTFSSLLDKGKVQVHEARFTKEELEAIPFKVPVMKRSPSLKRVSQRLLLLPVKVYPAEPNE